MSAYREKQEGELSSAVINIDARRPALKTVKNPQTNAPAMTKPRTQNNNLRMKKIIAPILGLLGLIMVWQLIAMNTQGGQFPTPLLTLQEAIKLFTDPFYRNSPNDQGIGWNILASLQRVALGFGLAALVGIPLGFLIGRFAFLSDMGISD